MDTRAAREDFENVQSWKPWHRFLGISFALLLVGGAISGVKEWLLRADTPMGFSDKRFRQITVGMSAEDVLNTLGPPFEFVVHSLGQGGTWNPPVNWNAPLHFTDVKDAAPFLSDQNNRVVLEYSRPRQGFDSFRARQIVIANRHVIKVNAYDYWGD
jgi:hypothetical protein